MKSRQVAGEETDRPGQADLDATATEPADWERPTLSALGRRNPAVQLACEEGVVAWPGITCPVAVPDRRSSPLLRAPGLWALGLVEAVTFVAVLVVMVEGNHAGLEAGLGFIHGCVYLLSLGVAWTLVEDSHTKGLAVIPGIGALLMGRALARTRRQRERAHQRGGLGAGSSRIVGGQRSDDG